MQVQSIAINKLIPYARNPRKNDTSIEKVAASIKEFGWKQPIVVDKDMIIIAGHTRWGAAKLLELEEAPVVIAKDLTPTQVKAYRLADNRTADESEWDDTLLALELDDLQGLDYDMSLTGFNAAEIDQLIASVDKLEEGLTEDDACPDLQEETISVLGDIWLLGRHRLLCGDATNIDHLDQLLQGTKADMVFTDPPYNVDYQGYTDEHLKIKKDNMSESEFTDFLNETFSTCMTAVKPGASLYVCHGSIYQREFQNAIESNGFEVRNQIIWAKHHFAWGHGRYKFQHEPIFYCHLKGESDAWYGDKSQSTLWKFNKPTANRLHPTMKPVELIENALKNSSKTGDAILDQFGGSGSTLIACEKMGRNAYLVELDPKYVDVAIKRWQEWTGKAALHEISGEKFDDKLKKI